VAGEKVVMIVDDTWAKPGWTGTITDQSRDGTNVRVRWDNGKRYHHSRKDMVTANSLDNPNVIFLLQKSKKEGS